MISSVFALLLGSLLITIAVVWAVGPAKLLAGLFAMPNLWALMVAIMTLLILPRLASSADMTFAGAYIGAPPVTYSDDAGGRYRFCMKVRIESTAVFNWVEANGGCNSSTVRHKLWEDAQSRGAKWEERFKFCVAVQGGGFGAPSQEACALKQIRDHVWRAGHQP